MLRQYYNSLVQLIVGQINSKCVLSKQKLGDLLIQQELNQTPESLDFIVALLLKDSADIDHL